MLGFNTRYEVCSTMMRLEEFYESPYKSIKGKYFTLEQFMDEYAKHKGNFTYTSDWSGFNVPSNVVDAFWSRFIPNLLQKELKLRQVIETIPDKKYYLIAVYKKGTEKALRHELAHAYYYLDPKYKKTMDELVEKFEYRKKMEAKLLKIGYCREVLKDEMQAYLSTYKKKFFNKKILDKKWKIPKKFKRVFKERNKL